MASYYNQNSSKIIRIRKDTTAFRNNHYNAYSGVFIESFPEVASYNFCDSLIGTIYGIGNKKQIYSKRIAENSSIIVQGYNDNRLNCSENSILTPTPTPTPTLTPTPTATCCTNDCIDCLSICEENQSNPTWDLSGCVDVNIAPCYLDDGKLPSGPKPDRVGVKISKQIYVDNILFEYDDNDGVWKNGNNTLIINGNGYIEISYSAPSKNLTIQPKVRYRELYNDYTIVDFSDCCPLPFSTECWECIDADPDNPSYIFDGCPNGFVPVSNSTPEIIRNFCAIGRCMSDGSSLWTANWYPPDDVPPSGWFDGCISEQDIDRQSMKLIKNNYLPFLSEYQDGTCCECEEIQAGAFGPNPSLEEPGSQADIDHSDFWVGVYNERLQPVVEYIQNNNYTCVVVTPYERAPRGSGGWTQSAGNVEARCCGIIDFDADPFVDYDGNEVYPCIPDETTRTCVDGVIESECNNRCGDWSSNCPSISFGSTCRQPEPCLTSVPCPAEIEINSVPQYDDCLCDKCYCDGGGRPLDIDVKCGSPAIIRPEESDFDLSTTSYTLWFLPRGDSALPVINNILYDTGLLPTDSSLLVRVHSTSTTAEMREWVCKNLRFVTVLDRTKLSTDINNAVESNWPYNDLYWDYKCDTYSVNHPNDVPINLVPC